MDDGTIAGVMHIHTNRSDGLSGPDEIAAAAARVGLKFVVFTDHGDATRRPDAPKTELRWRDWAAPFDGIELVNPDSSWRVWAQQSGWRPKLKLFAALVDYPF